MNDDIEVILADDCSPESYQEVVDSYRDILSIRQIKTDYNFTPGNTREKGVSIADGEGKYINTKGEEIEINGFNWDTLQYPRAFEDIYDPIWRD